MFSCLSLCFAADNESDKIGNVRATRLSAGVGADLKGFKSPTFQEANTYEYVDEEEVRKIVIVEGVPTAASFGFTAFALGDGRGRLLRQHSALKRSMDSPRIKNIHG